ncbi:hypothetical protein [Promicromonospora sp. MEB111]|uniref:hypothetical protein n=1 Tax=Promicromonospora sp. MEB111 TaxID=3040301 RepID=UPI00254B41E2|nr:hypothetical protein [Promicromonospora sp. MEB111]
MAVVRGIDERTAEKMLLDVANEAGVPLRTASDQFLTSLQSRIGREDLTSDTLDRALEAVAPAQLPHHDRLRHVQRSSTGRAA